MANEEKPKDRQEYIKAKIRKYGKNWKDYVSFGDPGQWKQKPNIRPKERKNRKYVPREIYNPLKVSKEKPPELIERQKRNPRVKPKYFPSSTLVERPPKKGGGIAQRGLGRAFNKGGKV